MLGLRFCARAFSSCGKRGPLLIVMRGPLTVAASLIAEHRLQTRRLSSRGSQAQSLCGMWDLPRPGLEPVSPALAGRFSTTAPPGKPQVTFKNPSRDFFKSKSSPQYSKIPMAMYPWTVPFCLVFHGVLPSSISLVWATGPHLAIVTK